MKITHISTSDIKGGAARAAHRLHLGLRAEGQTSRMLVGYKDSSDPSDKVPTNALLGRQAPRTPMPGPQSSENDQTSHRQLNPKFVEWLMGLPEDWLELTASESSATESSHSRRRSPSESLPVG